MAIEPRPTTTETRSRRAILAGALTGLAGLIAGRAISPGQAQAASGDPLIIGNTSNNAATANTSLTTSSTGTALLITQNGSGTALRGSAVGAGSIAGFFTANNGTGISGVSGNGNSYGAFAQNNGAAGSAGALRAAGGQNSGVVATTANANANAVVASNTAVATGTGAAIRVDGGVNVGVSASGSAAAVVGTALGDGSGIVGNSYLGFGVHGNASDGTGVYGESTYNRGVTGVSDSGRGVFGLSNSDSGLYGESTGGYGVYAVSKFNWAAYLNGDTKVAHDFQVGGNQSVGGYLAVTGAITAGTKDFKIDHPLDPAQKFLSHSCVESSDRKNVYDGVVTTNAKGEATVTLPAWFGALNGDFRYQLTPLGAAAPDLHVAAEIKDGVFSIAGAPPTARVSWQLTGIRQDPYAKAHPLSVEAAKTGTERGRYLHPEVYGKAASKGLGALQLHPTPARTPAHVPAAAPRP